jgi:exopolysaccharide biosynthesis polyprenyl glycosylphosphotransferase
MMNSDQIKIVDRIALVACDTILSFAAFVIAYYLRFTLTIFGPAEGFASLHSYFPMMLTQVFFIAITFFFYRLYHQPRALIFSDEFFSVFGAVSVSFMMSVAVTTLTLQNSNIQLNFSRGMLIYAWSLTIVFIVPSRVIIHRISRNLRLAGIGRDRVLIVGLGTSARLILQKIKMSPGLAYQLVGLVAKKSDASPLPREIGGVPVLGVVEDLVQIINEQNIDEVIIAIPDINHQEMVEIIGKCDKNIKIRIFPDTFFYIAGQVSIGDLGGLPLLSIRDVEMRGWRLTVKRIVDISLSFAALLLLSPLMALVAILVKLESRGPVFYVQERMGLDAKLFPMLKFRSMRQDAEVSGPGWTRPGDPRRTKVGAVIRRLNIDELPQLINVLLGQMSLVGPRAERAFYVEHFRNSIPHYMSRHMEKAGMTGWAQINGLRGDTSIEERTKYDLWYVENWSLTLDYKIMLRQLFQLFTSRNAY